MNVAHRSITGAGRKREIFLNFIIVMSPSKICRFSALIVIDTRKVHLRGTLYCSLASRFSS